MALVAGDVAYADGVNNLSINGIPLSDDPEIPPPSQPGYAKGDFDGWVTQVTVTDGAITIAARTGAITPKLCCVEIGPRNVVTDLTTVAPALVARVASMTSATVGGGNAALARQPRSYVVTPTYVDEVLGYVTGRGPEAQRYYAHANHLYSVAALTDAAGQVVERYSYNAYGKQTITAATGAVRVKSAVGWDRGFTGYVADNETSMLYARARMYSPTLGRFVGRDPLTYLCGTSMYAGYQVPNGLDPFGLFDLTGHNIIINRLAERLGIPPSVVAGIMAGSANVDARQGQGTAQNAHTHAMHGIRAGPFIRGYYAADKAESVRMAEKWIADNRQAARDAAAQYSVSRRAVDAAAASYALGRAMHTVMDMASPAHGSWESGIYVPRDWRGGALAGGTAEDWVAHLGELFVGEDDYNRAVDLFRKA